MVAVRLRLGHALCEVLPVTIYYDIIYSSLPSGRFKCNSDARQTCFLVSSVSICKFFVMWLETNWSLHPSVLFSNTCSVFVAESGHSPDHIPDPQPDHGGFPALLAPEEA